MRWEIWRTVKASRVEDEQFESVATEYRNVYCHRQWIAERM
jgi:hypothetical protein